MRRPLLAVVFAVLTLAARAPFLFSERIPFDSDEAVEGLMARHVLEGELPAFFWGQAFKGVPEVYASAAAFAVFGSSVTVLKSVTLVLFAVYVAMNFALLDRIASRWIAVCASLLLIAAPPALVFWSLDASAEYVLIMLLGTLLLMVAYWGRVGNWGRVDFPRDPGNSTRPQFPQLAIASLLIGLGLWVHQLFAVYLAPLAIVSAAGAGWWKPLANGKPSKTVVALAGLAAVYLVLAFVAFVTGGLSFHIGSVPVGIRAPQKMLRIAVGLAALAAMAHSAARITLPAARAAAGRYWPAVAAFVVGYSPVLLHSLLVEPARSPARNANLQQLLHAAPDVFGNIVPILAGFKIATTERLAIPAVAALPAAAALAAYVWSSRHRLTRNFFALYVLFMPLLFVVSGAYIDTQSYRYLVPWYAGLVVAWSAGSLAIGSALRAPRKAAALMIFAIAAVHAWQQVLWYQKLRPDAESAAAIECLRRNGFRGGYAEYWTAYKLTFLAGEQIIVAPTDGIDRYPPYTSFVQSLPAHERLDDVTRCR